MKNTVDSTATLCTNASLGVLPLAPLFVRFGGLRLKVSATEWFEVYRVAAEGPGRGT